MTTVTPSPGTAPGLPDHLSKLQDKAALAQSLLNTVMACMAAGNRDDLAFSLIDAAHDVAREINTGLDSVNLPGEATQ